MDWAVFCEFVRMNFRLRDDGLIVFRNRTAEDFPLVEDHPERAAALWNAAWGEKPVPVRGGRFMWCEVDKVALPWTYVRQALGVVVTGGPRQPRWRDDPNNRRRVVAAMDLREVCLWYGLDAALREYRLRVSEGEKPNMGKRRIVGWPDVPGQREIRLWELDLMKRWDERWHRFFEFDECVRDWMELNDMMADGYQRPIRGEHETVPFDEWVDEWCRERRIEMKRKLG